jgi:hypothetical protein
MISRVIEAGAQIEHACAEEEHRFHDDPNCSSDDTISEIIGSARLGV